MKSTKLLVFIVALQVLTVAGQWLGQPSMISTASAQIPDSGAQRQEMIDQMKSMNSKMDRLVSLLESGNVQVKTVALDGDRKSK